MASWQPVNSMQALVVAGLAGLYWKKFRMENQIIADRLTEKKCDECYEQKESSVWVPGSNNWNLFINLEASLDKEIAAKVKLLIQLKSFSAASQPLEGKSIEDPETDQDPPAESEINPPDEQGLAEEVKIVGTNQLSTIESIT